MNDEIFRQLSEIEECIRWYPTDLSIISNPEYIFEKNSQPRNIDLYVHIPFCKGTCGFCPFNQFSYVEIKSKRICFKFRGRDRYIGLLYEFELS
jgi:coproporphyrinogen III oxidase-like Fe-S oxidoreductase